MKIQLVNGIWTLQMRTSKDEVYMRPLFEYVTRLMSDIFSPNDLCYEPCIVYNDATADYPMLIINRIPIEMRINAVDLSYWSQFIFQLAHELTHYVIRKYKPNKNVIIKWFEETLCEAVSLFVVKMASEHWYECDLFTQNTFYSGSLLDYFSDCYAKTESSALQLCKTFQDLQAIEDSCESQRAKRSIERNYLVDSFLEMPTSVSAIVRYTLFVRGDIQINFDGWEQSEYYSPIVPRLRAIQPIVG
jgi:hypothetical protein